MKGSLPKVVLWLATITFVHEVKAGMADEMKQVTQPGGSTDQSNGRLESAQGSVDPEGEGGPIGAVAPEATPNVGVTAGMVKRNMKESAQADIIIKSFKNSTDNPIVWMTQILSGQQVFVPSIVDLDGRIFLSKIEDSHTIGGTKGPDRIEVETPPGAVRVLVDHYRFTKHDLPGADDKAAKPAIEWVGTLNGFSVLHELPGNIVGAEGGPDRAAGPGQGKVARVDIILDRNRNSTANVIKLDMPIVAGQQIFVPGTAKLDGKTFRTEIKGSRTIDGKPGRDRVHVEVPPGATRMIVGHFRFVKNEAPGVSEEATEWVGTLVGFGVVHEVPADLDKANVGPAPVVEPKE